MFTTKIYKKWKDNTLTLMDIYNTNDARQGTTNGLNWTIILSLLSLIMKYLLTKNRQKNRKERVEFGISVTEKEKKN